MWIIEKSMRYEEEIEQRIREVYANEIIQQKWMRRESLVDVSLSFTVSWLRVCAFWFSNERASARSQDYDKLIVAQARKSIVYFILFFRKIHISRIQNTNKMAYEWRI